MSYSKQTGEAHFYKANKDGSVTVLHKSKWARYWDEIVPLADRLFIAYTRQTGEAHIDEVDNNGKWGIIRKYTWSKHWDVIVGMDF